MATTSAQTTPATSPDIEGLSIILGTPLNGSDEPGRGMAYRPAGLAAGRLVHVHPTSSTIYLCAFRDTWTAGTPVPTAPGTYSAFTTVTRPSFWWVNSSGESTPATDRGGEPGRLYSKQDFTLISGTSYGQMVLYLGTVGGVPMLVTYRVDVGVVDFITSDWVTNSVASDGSTVLWDRGVFAQGQYIYIVGRRASDNALYMMKRDISSLANFYLSNKGWSNSPSELKPMTQFGGSVITSSATVTIQVVQGIWYMTTSTPGSPVTGRFYRSKHPLSPWRSVGATISLGTDSTTGVFLHSGVHANNGHPSLASPESVAGLVYSYTSPSSTALRTTWGVFPVPRSRL